MTKAEGAPGNFVIISELGFVVIPSDARDLQF